MSWEYVIKQGLQDESNAEIVSQLKAVTNRDVDPADCREFLDENDLWQFTPRGYVGPIQDAYNDIPSAQLHQGLDDLSAGLWGGAREKLRTSDKVIAQRFDAAFTVLIGANKMTAEHKAEFEALGGGLLFPGLDEAMVDQWKTDHVTFVARINLQQEYDQLPTKAINQALLNVDRQALADAMQANTDAIRNG